MTLTILASIFIAFLLLLALLGFRSAMQRPSSTADTNSEKCSICRKTFNKAMLIERQIGDYKLMHFCPGCIGDLHNEMVRKN